MNEQIVAIGSDWRLEPKINNLQIFSRQPENICQAMADLAGGKRYKLGTRISRYISCQDGQYGGLTTGDAIVALTPAQADAAQRLIDAIQAYAVEVAEAATLRESHFLLKLANGEATVADYERRIK